MRASGPQPRRFPAGGAAMVLAAVALVAACAHLPPPKSPPPPPEPPVDPGGPYGFLGADDPVGRAMATLWRAQFERHADPVAAAAAFQASAQATGVVEAGRERAVALLMPTLLTLVPNDSGGYLSLGPLLAPVVDHPEIVRYFHRLLLAPPATEEETGEGTVSEAGLVRGFALNQLVAAGERGSEPARESLLDLLEHGPPEVIDGAIQAVYRISSDRRQAQREMRRRLAPERHHLLYRY